MNLAMKQTNQAKVFTGRGIFFFCFCLVSEIYNESAVRSLPDGTSRGRRDGRTTPPRLERSQTASLGSLFRFPLPGRGTARPTNTHAPVLTSARFFNVAAWPKSRV